MGVTTTHPVNLSALLTFGQSGANKTAERLKTQVILSGY